MILTALYRIAHPCKEVPLDAPEARAPWETLQCTDNTERSFNYGSEGWGGKMFFFFPFVGKARSCFSDKHSEASLSAFLCACVPSTVQKACFNSRALQQKQAWPRVNCMPSAYPLWYKWSGLQLWHLGTVHFEDVSLVSATIYTRSAVVLCKTSYVALTCSFWKWTWTVMVGQWGGAAGHGPALRSGTRIQALLSPSCWAWLLFWLVFMINEHVARPSMPSPCFVLFWCFVALLAPLPTALWLNLAVHTYRLLAFLKEKKASNAALPLVWIFA